MISAYIVDIIILLVAAVVAVPLFQMVRLGAVPGFLIAGIIVGPYGLGLIDKVSEIGHIAEIGVVFLLFVIGIELRPTRLWQMRRLVFGLGTMQVVISGLVIGCVGYFIFDISMEAAILAGPALALSSTAIVLQLLSEQKLLLSGYGRTAFSILLLQDLAIVPLLALVPLLAMSELSIGVDIGLALLESLLILALVILLGRYLLHPVLHRVALSRNPEIFTASAVLIVIGTALITERAGFSMAMGAFLAGLLISDSSYRHQVMAEIQPFRGLLLGLFFMSMGMSLNINLLAENPLNDLGLLAALLVIKAMILFPLVSAFGVKGKNGIAVSMLLAQSGEFALVLFSLAFQSEILGEHLYQQFLLVVLLSMLVTPLLAQWARRLVRKEAGPEKADDITVEAPIVLAGFGRVGHRIGEILLLAGKTFVALDSDPALVEKERENGHPVFYGDVRRPEVLKAAGASNAQVIIVTLNDPSATEAVVSTLRKIYPEKHIYARAHSLNQCRELRVKGATGVVSENIEASLELARMVMTNVGVDENKGEAILMDFRQTYQAQIEEAVRVEKTKS